ncbi:hypothetical protein ACFL3V_03740 [Nanoarchaeota archaeon]
MGYVSMSSGGAYRAPGIDQVVNKFYVNVGTVNVHNGDVNNGIQHSIAAERTGDVHIHNYNQTIDNRIGVQNNYVLNLDNRKVEFIAPYVGDSGRGDVKYLDKKDQYLLEGPSGQYDSSTGVPAYSGSITSGLLKKRRPVTQFVDDASEVQGMVVETFEKLTGQAFPDNIVVRVCDEKSMKKAHSANGGTWSPGIMGFALNRGSDNSSVFVRKNHLDALMLTLGHEIGHVVAPLLGNPVDEEAKAFAFELAWAKCIVENDIGGLADSFDVDFMPAANGLHDKAFAFVQDAVQKGKDSLRIFWEVAKGMLSVKTSS